MEERLYEILSEHLTERKRILFDQIAANRTRYITLVMEDLYQAQNTSAIQRSAESWGIQDLYVIENTHTFSHHRRIARGAYDWLSIHRFNNTSNNTQQCFDALREKGYQIAVTALHAETIPLHQIDLSKKTAVVMGTELTGASDVAMQQADLYIKIPTYGFTESLNVSAASSVIMHYLIERIRNENQPWQLTQAEQLHLKIDWAKKSIHWSKYLIDMYESGELK